MSLVSLVLRIATVRVLRGATFAHDRVHDSMIDPASLVEREAAPFIVVAVDGAQGTPTGKDLLGTNYTTQLTLDLGVAAKVVVPKPAGTDDDGPTEFLAIAHTDAGMEITLDLMVRQVHRALMAAQGPWADLWRKIVTKVEKAQADRGAASDEGVRYATRQFILAVHTMAEPSFAKAEGVWKEAITLMRGEPDLLAIAELLENEIEKPDLDGWARSVADLGLRDRGALGGEALVEEAPPITGATVQFEGGAWGVDAESIAEALGPNPEQQEE